MLSLTRRPGQRIVIGDDIVIQITRITSDRGVQIDIQAPIEIPIFREEIYARIKAEEAGNDGT